MGGEGIGVLANDLTDQGSKKHDERHCVAYNHRNNKSECLAAYESFEVRSSSK